MGENNFDNEMVRSERALHTPGTFAKKNLLYLQEVGLLESIKPHRCVREELNSYLFLVVLEGKGEIRIGKTAYQIKAGDAALIDCMQHYEHVSDEKNAWKLAWAHFNGKVAKDYYELFMKLNQGENVFRVKSVNTFKCYIEELLKNNEEKSLISELRSGELLLKLLNDVLEGIIQKETRTSSGKQVVFEQTREFLNEHYAEKDVISQIQKENKESIEDLNQEFSRRYGIGIKEYVDNRRLLAAKELLRFSIKSFETIAEEVGIGNQEALNKIFRAKEGISPEEYRMKWAQWIR